MELSRTSKSLKQNRLAVNADPFTVMRCRVIVLSITSNAVPAPRTENSSAQRLVPRSNEDLIALHPRMISQPCPGVFRMNRNRISALLFITVGAVLGHIAATGHFTFHRSAGAQNVPAGLAGQEVPQASCSEGLNKAKLLAMAGPATVPAAVQAQEASSSKKPNIVVIMSDDVGWFNIGAYHRGIMAGRTPNLDTLASQGMLFTDYYAEASCTAGRANFITGQIPIRTGLTTVGQAGATVGMPAQAPTIATALKTQGYATGQFGKNHLGDRNEYLPTVHGFDEFFGYLYHLDAME